MKHFSLLTDKKSEGLLLENRDEIIKLFGDKLKEIILYGSHAGSDFSDDSDIDIMILVDDDVHHLKTYREKISDIRVNLSLKFDKVISIIIKSHKEYNKHIDHLPFYARIQNEGIEIYGR